MATTCDEFAEQKLFLGPRFDGLNIEGRIKSIDPHFHVSPIVVAIVPHQDRAAFELGSLIMRHLIKIWMRDCHCGYRRVQLAFVNRWHEFP